MDEAEANVRKQMKDRKGTDIFVQSARISTYNKIFGLDPKTAYRSVTVPNQKPAESSDGTVDLSVFNKKENQ